MLLNHQVSLTLSALVSAFSFAFHRICAVSTRGGQDEIRASSEGDRGDIAHVRCVAKMRRHVLALWRRLAVGERLVEAGPTAWTCVTPPRARGGQLAFVVRPITREVPRAVHRHLDEHAVHLHSKEQKPRYVGRGEANTRARHVILKQQQPVTRRAELRGVENPPEDGLL